jgi:hypothetical protein
MEAVWTLAFAASPYPSIFEVVVRERVRQKIVMVRMLLPNTGGDPD